MDLLPFLYAAGAGGLGGLGYSYYNKLLTVSTYLAALEHLGAGALAGLLVVGSGSLPVPNDYASGFLVAAIGYGGTDVIDSFLQKLRSLSGTPAPPP